MSITKEGYKRKARKRYQIISKEEKEQKWQYGGERYKNFLKNKSWSSIEKYYYKMKKLS